MKSVKKKHIYNHRKYIVQLKHLHHKYVLFRIKKLVLLRLS